MNGNAIKNFEVQGILAKLLATENISVHVGEYSTAFFDVKNRILGLPSWNVDSKEVSDLLIGHEVGHALWTPVDGIEKFKAEFPKIPFSILNIVEDIRIERKIKDQYPGLRSTFLRGYTYFIEKDFFKIAGKNLNEMTFCDRLNIKSKLQELIDIDFTPEEKVICDRCNKAETFEEVIQLVSDIYKMVKQKPKKKDKSQLKEAEQSKKKSEDQSNDNGNNEDPTQGDDEIEEENTESGEQVKSESGETQESETVVDESDDTEEVKSNSSTNNDSDESDESDDESEFENTEIASDEDISPTTQNSLDNELSKLHTDFGSARPIIPPSKKDSLNTIVPWIKVQESRIMGNYNTNYKRDFIENVEIKEDWSDFKSKTKSHIQYLVTNFERRKAAYQYSRARVSDTGDIALNKLHAYRYDDQIFNSITSLADAKDHGMLFFIDYSGSMSSIISNVINQTLNLVMFCKAVSIPFRVYGFTSSTSSNVYEQRETITSNTISMADTKLIELVRSDMSKSNYDIAIRYMRAQSVLNAKGYFCGKLFSNVECLNQTPLIQCIIAAHDIVDDFRKFHKVQKLNTIFITDGASNSLSFGYDRTNEKYTAQSTHYKNSYTMKLHGRNIKLRREKNENYNYSILIENLKLTKNCTTIGFYLSDRAKNTRITSVNAFRYNRNAGFTDEHRPTWLSGEEKFKGGFSKQMKKDKVGFVHGGFNYECFFIMESANLKIDDEDDFVSDTEYDDFKKKSNQNKLVKEFEKYNSSKKNSRVFLAKFAEIIA